MHSQREPCVDIRRIFRDQLLHARIQLIDRALTLQYRLDAVCFFESYGDLMDILPVAQDCSLSVAIFANKRPYHARELTSLEPNNARVQRNSHGVFRGVGIGLNLPHFFSTAPVHQTLLIRVPRLQKAETASRILFLFTISQKQHPSLFMLSSQPFTACSISSDTICKSRAEEVCLPQGPCSCGRVKLTLLLHFGPRGCQRKHLARSSKTCGKFVASLVFPCFTTATVTYRSPSKGTSGMIHGE